MTDAVRLTEIGARCELTPEDRALVLETRAHWVRMAEDPLGCEETPGCEDYPLCQHYQVHTVGGCGECVVGRAGGGWLCMKTPTPEAATAFQRMRESKLTTAFQARADDVIAWIDEHLLEGEERSADA